MAAVEATAAHDSSGSKSPPAPTMPAAARGSSSVWVDPAYSDEH